MSDVAVATDLVEPARLPRIGFVGLGWIGHHRMHAAIAAGALQPVAFVEPNDELAAKAAGSAPQARRFANLHELLMEELDGVVIATPSAAHAEQSIAALEAGCAVFCQKPLGRTRAEVEQVLQAARAADRLLGVDLSYRFTRAATELRQQIAGGALGRLYAVDLVFHNAYGPDKAWFYDRALAGGGCVMDLGVHLIDLALWASGEQAVGDVEAQLFAGGERWRGREVTEDFAFASLRLGEEVAVRLACSWRLHAGQDAVISASFFGDRGALAMRNVGGSFYDFVAERCDGTSRTVLCQPPDAWGGRAIVDWAQRLRRSAAFDPGIDTIAEVAGAIDRIYGSDRALV